MLERNPTAVSTMETSAIRVVKQHPYDETILSLGFDLLGFKIYKDCGKSYQSTIKIFKI